MGLVGGLHVDLSGRQNAKFVCRMLGHDHDMQEKVDFIEDFAEIGEAFDEPVKTYSSGMRSRLKFAISLAFEFDGIRLVASAAIGSAFYPAEATDSAELLKLADQRMYDDKKKQKRNANEG